MKRTTIPDPIIVSLTGGKETPRAPTTNLESPKDLREVKVDEFIAARSLKPKSEKAYRRDLQYFMDWTRQTWVAVTRRQVAQFKQYLLQERQLAPNSVNRILRTLKTFYKWMLESEYLSHDPTTGVKQEKVPEAQSQELEDDEVERIYTAISEISRDPVRDRALFSVLLHGLRAEESINLNFEDYDGSQVVVREAKHNSVGEVPLTRQARTDLDAYIHQRQVQARSTGQEVLPQSPLFISNSNRSKGQRLTYWGVQEVMKQLAEYTGIDLHAHRGRHTFCTNLIVKLEMDTALAMELSRHRDIRSFKRYTNRKNKLAAKRAFLKATEQLD
ncbi:MULTISPECIES: tyrosine-type recombinase/integrase [unclassified Leptolyngbya]|uniref:tyrosine-type recombinase/integrase n=1 Tax=unclassified Leptolyngbya TaxID=2650499 RepID=UPI0016893143|nr:MULTISPECIES: tyrosine-type recombinase/integrase [unclassified Leptolyngbya]MBD1913174.1 tyrosine-type recombinase/integrase [Leptolyngbya sp. FACHB-8]MBD2156694.1 tyrosine-type recombinase/integrase [Leptolyngbya sp. FACHB-16]